MTSSVARIFCPAAPQVLETKYDSLLADVTVSYMCADSAFVYTESRHEPFQRNNVYLFNNSSMFDSDKQLDNVQRCRFDDGFTAPPVPFFSGSNSTCENAVLDVDYQFHWTGTSILRLNATVILGNISVGNASSSAAADSHTLLTQHHTAKFLHNSTEQHNDDLTLLHRSGNPGYENSMLVLSGTLINNTEVTLNSQTNKSTVTEDVWIDTNASAILKIISSSVDGLCYHSNWKHVTFGESIQSGCVIRLGLSQLLDCTELQTRVTEELQQAFPSSHISRGGNPHRGKPADWLQIVKETEHLLDNEVLGKSRILAVILIFSKYSPNSKNYLYL